MQGLWRPMDAKTPQSTAFHGQSRLLSDTILRLQIIYLLLGVLLLILIDPSSRVYLGLKVALRFFFVPCTSLQ